jgi:plastocyanin
VTGARRGCLCLLALLAACSPPAERGERASDPAGEPAAAVPPEPGPPPWAGARGTFGGTADVTGLDDVVVTLHENYFQPTRLTGTAGQSLLLRLANEGRDVHNLSLPEQGIDVDVAPGEVAEVSVVLPESGALRFFCTYHLWHNMRGELAVSG